MAAMALRTDIDSLPTQPGVYLMRDASEDVLYVGKAVDLRARVRQYFARSGGDGRFHIEFLVPRIQDVEVVVTRTEREALILEDTLIKKYQPRYNVKLKDDKSWLSVRLNLKEEWPRVTTVRRWRDDGAKYFGPYLNELNAWEVMKLLKRTVPLRTCTDSVFRAHRDRPCIEFQMGRCAAPCVEFIDKDGYDDLVQEATLLLEGRNRELARKLETRMHSAAKLLNYEGAARIRDSLRLIERLAEKQTAHAAPGKKDRDVFALHREGELAAVAMLPVREGRLQDARAWTFRGVAEEDSELLGRLITQLYSPTIPPPPEILTQVEVDEAELRAELLGEIKDRKVQIRVPKRGDGVRLLDLATRNASVRFQAAHSKQERAEQALFELQDRLHLTALPRHIECYDNSNIQGTDPVGSLVTFRDGRPWKKGYRIFKIKTVEGADDFASMKEVLGRRFKRAKQGDAGWELPDLVLIDGGRGQLGMVVAACRELNVDVLGPGGNPLPLGSLPGDHRRRRQRWRMGRDGDAGAWAVPPPPVDAGPGVFAHTSKADAEAAGDEPAETGPEASAPAEERLAIRVISIAKPREGEDADKIYEPGRRNPVPFRPYSAGLHLLQALRDEAHRFGVSHHRKQRRKRTLTSELDSIPGVGPALRKKLLRHFGSLKKVKAASVEELSGVRGIGAAKARTIHEALTTDR